MKRLMKNESGVALVFTLMVLVVLSVLGATIGTVAMANVNLTENERDYQAAYYIAEAGVNETYVNIEEIVHQAYDNNMTEAAFFDEINDEINDELMAKPNFSNFEEIEGMKPTAKVQVNYHDGDIIISSTSQLGKINRSVEKKIDVNWIDKSSNAPTLPADALFYVENSIILSGSSNVTGNVYTGAGSKKKEIKINEKNFNGTLYVRPEVKNEMGNEEYNVEAFNDFAFETIRSYVNSIEAPKTGKDMSEISNSDLNGTYIAENAEKSIYNFNESSLKVDSNTVNLVFNDVRFNSDLRIEGSGVVNLFVKGSIDINKKGLNIGGDPKQLNIFYVGDETLDLQTKFDKVNGSVIVKSSEDIIFNGGELTGRYLIAPNANIYLRGNGEFNTTFVAKSLEVNANITAQFTGENTLPNPGGGSDSGSGNLSDLILSNPTYEK